MYIEYCNYNRSIPDYEKEKENIYEAISNGVNCLAMPIYIIKDIKEMLQKDMNIDLAAPIDYPLGHSSTKAREGIVLNSIRMGATKIDYVPNHYLLKNSFKELHNELKTIKSICTDNDVELRVFLDHRNSNEVITVARMFYILGVNTVFPTLGYHGDDFYDNLIQCSSLEKETSVKTIFNGQIWRLDQLEMAVKAKIFGVRLYNTRLWCKYKSGQDKTF